MKKPSNPFQYVIIFLLLITCIQTCSFKGRIKGVYNELDSLSIDLSHIRKDIYLLNDSISKLPNHSELRKTIKVEGLKVEKRMIQSTNRNMMDLNRQSEIDKELQLLENK